MSDWRKQMAELESAEEFLEFFGVECEAAVVRVHRLHILQRFHDRVKAMTDAEQASRHMQATAMRLACEEFSRAGGRHEPVFRGERRAVAMVPVASIGRGAR